MAARGKRSAEELAIAPLVTKSLSRIKLRSGASPDVAAIFRELVANVDPEHWRPADTHLLEQYAQSIALARDAFAALEREGPVVNGRANPWNVVLEKAHRSSVALSMRLRLAPQSRIDPKTAGRASRTAGAKRPWDGAEPWGDDVRF